MLSFFLLKPLQQRFECGGESGGREAEVVNLEAKREAGDGMGRCSSSTCSTLRDARLLLPKLPSCETLQKRCEKTVPCSC